MEWVKPRALRPGGTVGVVAPSGPVDVERLVRGLGVLRDCGLRPALAGGLLERRPGLAGEDAVRAEGLRVMLLDPDIDAVVCARGGYGAMRILPECDFVALRRAPKPLLGFSDVTALHVAAGAARVVTYHGPMVECEVVGEADLRAALAVLGSREPLGPLAWPVAAPRPRALHPGRAEGRIVGGNLTLLAATLGTPWEVDAAGCLLLLEDVGESAYRLDRCLTQLWLAGKLQAAVGFLLGELVGCGDPEGPTGLEVLAQRLLPLGKPCLADLPLGHGRPRLTVPLGVHAVLDADARELAVTEAAAV